MSRPLRSSTSTLLALVILAASLLFSATLAASPAHALCATPELNGSWRNITTTRSVTGVDVGFQCGDVCLNGVCPRTGYVVRVFGSCSPTDCDWGQEELDEVGSDGWLRATYAFGWSTKHVWVRPYTYGSTTYLRVWVWTDFHDGRTDYASNDWLRRA